jgi:hypothetical protein
MVEGAHFDARGELLLYGFRSKHFVLWNESRQREVMSVECGGAHRRWSYFPASGIAGGSFAYLKASHLHLHIPPTQQVLQSGTHGREIKSCAISPPLLVEEELSTRRRRLVASGAEDTAIRLSSYKLNLRCSSRTLENTFRNTSKHDVPSLQQHTLVRDHTTGIQHLQWSRCGRWLFSSGGVEEFFVWRVRNLEGYGVGIVREGVCPRVDEEEPDLRITGFVATEIGHDIQASRRESDEAEFLITMVFSDSTLRVRRPHLCASSLPH